MPNIIKEPNKYIHGTKLKNKVNASKEKDEELNQCLEAYQHWKNQSLAVQTREKEDVEKLVNYLNDYKDTVEPIFDLRKNSAQEVLQPSILEEFFEYLFCNIESELGKDLLRAPARGYVDLAFNPSSLDTLLNSPEYTIRQKDHDFVLGATIGLSISAVGSNNQSTENLVIPAVAIECKRYLERNMLDECSGTAGRVKSATPYCKYFVVAEYLKMNNASPEISLIDEIYILRRQRNSERNNDHFIANPIYSDLIFDIYERCIQHLKKIWWNPSSALEDGKVFNFD